MPFNSLTFVAFFVIVCAVYFVLPERHRLRVLLLSSLFWYGAPNALHLGLIAAMIAFNYFVALKIEQRGVERSRKRLLWCAILLNIGILAAFKYLNFVFEVINTASDYYGLSLHIIPWNVALPTGISFFTFQILSYVIDIYRRKYKTEQDLTHFSLYITFFPQLVAGPIERSTTLIPQFFKKHPFDYKRVTDGLKLMAWGYFKKLVVADGIALAVNPVYADPGDYTAGIRVFVTYLYCFQIYYDFSGYIDIGTGAARVLGYDLSKNFDRPYYSRSISEFWRRWHITLGTWIRDYIYIPLGGFDISRLRWAVNIMIVFFLSGLWHGASWNFIFWGLYHGALIVVSFLLFELFQLTGLREIAIKNLSSQFRNIAAIVITFHLVALGWVIFRAPTMLEANEVLFSFWPGMVELFTHPFEIVGGMMSRLGLGGEWLFKVIVGIIIVELIDLLATIKGINFESFREFPLVIRWTLYQLLVLAILYGARNNTPQFIYFRF